MRRLAKILAILIKRDPTGYVTAYNDTISLAKDVGPENFTKHELARLRALGARWIPPSKRVPGGYWVTCW
jgi:hypothetical protein